MKRIAVWLFIALIVGGGLSLWASTDPDGFERAGEDLGYLEQERVWYHAPFADYHVPGLPAWLSQSLAGIVGVLLAFALFWLIGRGLASRPAKPGASARREKEPIG
ncbi:MAG: PDGLE domain-containing protein [Hydrogenibacillus schlegelii]|uniref:PDGLE domain-containing protein n=1 Tax=Hydrogenibacillus schlegelii TaxID=1484 RepID=A0A947GAK0_HYDSH|nr:PDGLE domain-containing protein [Hydrogenibacillus schlegelii]MBT9283244.1 PDGLE domain-containing protein [Hydrogenibacillus schlegelii]